MHLRPKDFPEIGDEEYGFDSYDEDTDEDISDSHVVKDAGGEALGPVDDPLETGTSTDNVAGEAQLIQDDPENTTQEFPLQGEEEDAPLLTNSFTSIN